MIGSGNAIVELAGLGEEPTDVMSDRHPYLHLAERRARTARLTPGGLPQPPEVMGVDADARVPNQIQPMDGEMLRGREVGEGRPAFFGRDMPAPTGISNGQLDHLSESRVSPVALPKLRFDAAMAPVPRPFGAPTGMPAPIGNDRFSPAVDLSGLPHFAAGGTLAPGATGVVGEGGEEAVTALPGGGVRIAPLADLGAVDLSGLGPRPGATPPVANSEPRVRLADGRTGTMPRAHAATLPGIAILE